MVPSRSRSQRQNPYQWSARSKCARPQPDGLHPLKQKGDNLVAVLKPLLQHQSHRAKKVQSGGSEVLCRVAVPEQEPAGKDEERKNYTLQLRLLRVLQPVARAISLRSGR